VDAHRSLFQVKSLAVSSVVVWFPDGWIQQAAFAERVAADTAGEKAHRFLVRRRSFLCPRRVCRPDSSDLPPDSELTGSSNFKPRTSGFEWRATPSHPPASLKLPTRAPKATSKPPQSLLIGNRLRPESLFNATLKPPQSHPNAVPKPPQSHLCPVQHPTSSPPTRRSTPTPGIYPRPDTRKILIPGRQSGSIFGDDR
jgi:hypothetical protein